MPFINLFAVFLSFVVCLHSRGGSRFTRPNGPSDEHLSATEVGKRTPFGGISKRKEDSRFHHNIYSKKLSSQSVKIKSSLSRSRFSRLRCSDHNKHLHGFLETTNVCLPRSRSRSTQKMDISTSTSSSDQDYSLPQDKTVHTANITEVHEVPIEILIRPIPSVLDEKKVQSLMETLQVTTVFPVFI